jgi:hypothetical protein
MSCEKKTCMHGRAAVLTAALLMLSAAGCGKKGDPLPPLRIIPNTTQDLRIQQQGRLMLLEMAYPNTTISGMVLGGIDSVTLFELVRPVPEGAEPPLIDRNEFIAAAKPLLELKGSELGATITGDRIQIRVPLADPLPTQREVHVFGVRTSKGAEVSDLSNLVTLVPREPPAAPSDLELTAGPQGVELRWKHEATDLAGFDVYRREAQDRGYGAPIQQVPGNTTTHLDRTAVLGKRYIYTVRGLAQTQPPIRSAEAGEREIDFQDRFAPPLPLNFVALGERGKVRLRWDASRAPDVAGYVIYRREPGRDFRRLDEHLFAGLEFIDEGLASGLAFSYRIQAVDKTGNESELSEPVTAVVR